MVILGLNAYHADSAACLIRNGQVIAAAEEERFCRIKHWAGFPTQAIQYCLDEAGISLADVAHVAVNSDPAAHLLRKVGYALRKRPKLSLILKRIRIKTKRQAIGAELARRFPHAIFKGITHRVEHHIAHLSSCFLVSPFKEAVTVSVDGFGDFSSAAWGVGQGNKIRVDGRVYFPHSLGVFYQALTQYLGFHRYGDEYKVMGLAPYGKPRHMHIMRRLVILQHDGSFALDPVYFRHHKENIDYQWSSGSPVFGRLYSDALIDLLGPERNDREPLEQKHLDIARSVQAMYEDAFFHLLNKLHARYRLDSLTLAGGCAMNSVANGKAHYRTPFKRLYVQSAAGDAGGALGAAIAIWHKLNPQRSLSGIIKGSQVLAGDVEPGHSVMDHAYLGPGFTDNEVELLLRENSDELAAQGCEMIRMSDDCALTKRAAEEIANGKVVGWFQGRMEWGPRALGNRSIVCDPRRGDIKDILNLKIKRRESFRPFAPSIIREHVSEWFESDADVPFMMQVYQIRAEKRPLVPAVTHIDGSGRLQTVYRQSNLRYWMLIDEFRKLSGVPMILNTSFNENEPIVCRPIEALNCFLRTKMDVLVMGHFFVQRSW